MKIDIYPYKIIQRTPYSKMQMIDVRTGEYITKKCPEMLLAIAKEYDMQITDPLRYFNIENIFLNSTEVSGTPEIKNDRLNYLFIPEGCEIIGKNAFDYGFFNLINLPESTKVIQDYAFCGSDELKHIKIPDSVEYVGASCFKDCVELKSVIFPNIEILSKCIFNNCQNLNKIILPENLKKIEMGAFNWCLSLEKIIIPENVKEISDYTFNHCVSLRVVKLPESLTTIGANAFSDCYSLKSLSIPDTVSKIEREAFMGCGLETFKIPRDLKTIGWRPFCNSDVKSLIFNNDLKELYNEPHLDKPNNLLEDSRINTIVIDKNVNTITPDLFGSLGYKIKKIEYLGTKKEYDKFRENNKKLFDTIAKVEDVVVMEDTKMTDKEMDR